MVYSGLQARTNSHKIHGKEYFPYPSYPSDPGYEKRIVRRCTEICLHSLTITLNYSLPQLLVLISQWYLLLADLFPHPKIDICTPITRYCDKGFMIYFFFFFFFIEINIRLNVYTLSLKSSHSTHLIYFGFVLTRQDIDKIWQIHSLHAINVKKKR